MSSQIVSTPDIDTVEGVYPSLNAVDRCDRCNAQAYVRWTKSAADMLMCGHHSNKHEAALTVQGWAIHEDNRAVLTNKLTAAY